MRISDCEGFFMSTYFVMSRRFDKRTASDFGLSDLENGMAVRSSDGSLWQKALLYDLGWGPENGYYRVPLPDFPQLLDIVLRESDEEDVFGAAAMIERQYPELLLERCEEMMPAPARAADFEKMVRIFRLYHPVNRCPIEGKQADEIQSDSERWSRVAESAAAVCQKIGDGPKKRRWYSVFRRTKTDL